MTREIHFCRECYSSYGVELHHIIYRSENKNLEKCKLNHAYLCQEHHRGTYGVHGTKGAELNNKLKLEFQNTLETLFIKEYLTEEEISKSLGTSENATYRLLKTLKRYKEGYSREEVILRCMNGKRRE